MSDTPFSSVSFESVESGSVGGGFTAGRRTITLNKRGGSSKEGGRRTDRPRISLKDRRPVYEHADESASSSAAGASADAVASSGPDGVAASAGKEQRRRVVEVRQRQSRDAQLSSRRRGGVSSESSGFNTSGGHRRAMIVLPRNEEKMAAREKLMQMHPHIAQVFRGINPPDVFQQDPFNRVLAAEAPCLPYRRRNMETKSVVESDTRRRHCMHARR